jgi:ABC-type glycerol-3-phosphate transport system substrate-binding protein
MSTPSFPRRVGAAVLLGALVAASATFTLQRNPVAAAESNDAAESAIADSLKGLAKPNEFSGVTLRFATRHLPPMDFVVKHLDAFEKYTGAKVQVTEYGENELRDKIVADASTHAGQFDLYNLDGNYTPLFASNKWVQPIDNLPASYNVGDILPFARGLYTYGGKLYGAPIYLETTILYYRKDLFAAAGIAGPPKTMDEFAADAAKLLSPPRTYGVALRGLRGEGMNVYIWSEWLHSYGGDFFKDGKLIPAFDSAQAADGTKHYAALINKYGPPNSATWGWPEVLSAYSSGRIGMTIESTAFYPIFTDPKQSSVVGKVGFAPVPAGPSGRWPANYTTGIAIASTVTDPKQLAAAKALLAFGTSEQMEKGGLAEESIANVARTSLLHSDLYNEKITKVSPDYAAAVAEDYKITSVNYRPLIPQWKAMGDSIGTAIEGAFTGQTQPAAALKNAAGEVTTLFKTQKVYGNPYVTKKGDAAMKAGGAKQS